jgi:hypothetical protein
MARQLTILLAALAGGTALALAIGAKNLGTALGVGQLCFTVALVYVLMRD